MFLMPENKWARLLAYVTGLVNRKLRLHEVEAYLMEDGRGFQLGISAEKVVAPNTLWKASISRRYCEAKTHAGREDRRQTGSNPVKRKRRFRPHPAGRPQPRPFFER
jgi:hypothetical protein